MAVLAFPLLLPSEAAGQTQDLRLESRCALAQPAVPAGQPAPAASEPVVRCDLRASQPAAPRGARAEVEGRVVSSIFETFDSGKAASSWLFLVQNSAGISPKALRQIRANVGALGGPRQGLRRFGLATFSDKLDVLAPLGSPDKDFQAALGRIRASGQPVSELYRNSRDALAILEKDGAARRALVIIGNGRADDKAYTRQELVEAARKSNVLIYALGHVESATNLPHLQTLRRIAEDSGGIYAQADVGSGQLPKAFRDAFVSYLENVGHVDIPLSAFGGQTRSDVTLTVDFVDGRSAAVTETVDLTGPVAPPPAPPGAAPSPGPSAAPGPGVPPDAPDTAQPDAQPETLLEQLLVWIQNNQLISAIVGALLIVGVLAPIAKSRRQAPVDDAEPYLVTGPLNELLSTSIPISQSEQLRNAPERTYGWLHFLDASSTKVRIGATTVRIGRHEDNDIRLDNKTVHRRHAVMHLAPDQTFVIRDLGTRNGIFVNRERVDRKELRDGDIIELGEVRFRFYASER